MNQLQTPFVRILSLNIVTLAAGALLLFGSFAPLSAVSAALVLYRASTYFVPFAVSLPTVFIMQRTKTKRLEAKGGQPEKEE